MNAIIKEYFSINLINMIFNDPLFDGMNVIEFNKVKTGTSPHKKKTFLIKLKKNFTLFISLLSLAINIVRLCPLFVSCQTNTRDKEQRDIVEQKFLIVNQ